jgi:drug/metabolite transporter (DMT)-like permease
MTENTARAYTPAGILAAAGGVFTWGLGVVFIKLTDSSFLVVSFYRHVFSLPLLLLVWAFHKDKRLSWRAAGIGGVLFAAHQLANFSALRHASAATVTILFSIQPIIVGALGGRFVGEEATTRFYLWSTVAVAGCAVVVFSSTGDATTSPLGAALAVTNLVAWCAYYLASKRARESVTTISWMLVMTLVSGAIVGAIALIARAPFGEPSGNEWLFLIAVGVLPGTVGHLLVTWAHPRIHVAASSALILGVPIIATAGTAVFVGEPFGPWQAVGGVLALGATANAMRHLPSPVAAEAAEHYGEVAS